MLKQYLTIDSDTSWYKGMDFIENNKILALTRNALVLINLSDLSRTILVTGEDFLRFQINPRNNIILIIKRDAILFVDRKNYQLIRELKPVKSIGLSVTLITGAKNDLVMSELGHFLPEPCRLEAGKTEFYNLDTGKIDFVISGYADLPGALNPNENHLVIKLPDQLEIWDLHQRKIVRTYDGLHGLSRFKYSNTGILLAATHDNTETVHILDAQTGATRHVLGEIGHGNSLPVFNPADSIIACWDEWSNAVRLWDSTTGTQLDSIYNSLSRTKSLSFSPDGTLLGFIVCDEFGRDGTIEVWTLT